MTLNRLLFAGFLAVLALLVTGMLFLSTRTPSGPEGLAALASALVFAGILVLIIELMRRAIRRTQGR